MQEQQSMSSISRHFLLCIIFLSTNSFADQPQIEDSLVFSNKVEAEQTQTQTAAAKNNGTRSLTTVFDGTAAGGGIYFNITANDRPILVTHFDVNFRIDGMAEVYSKSGSHVGFEQTPSAWLSRGSMSLNGLPGKPTMLDIQDVIIPANETVGFYMVSFNSAGFGYSFGVALGETFVNEDISLFTITSHSGDTAFAGGLFSPRTWNGTVYYELYESETCFPIKAQTGATAVVCL